MGCFEKHGGRRQAARTKAAREADWIDISALPAAEKQALWLHLQANHPNLALLLGDAELNGFAWVPGAEIWIERRCLPAALAAA